MNEQRALKGATGHTGKSTQLLRFTRVMNETSQIKWCETESLVTTIAVHSAETETWYYQWYLPSSASLIVFRFWPKMAKYAYFKEPLLTHSNSLKRVQVSRLIRTFCARNNMRAFLSERYFSCNLSSKMTISHSRLAGTKIFQTMNMQEIFEISHLT